MRKIFKVLLSFCFMVSLTASPVFEMMNVPAAQVSVEAKAKYYKIDGKYVGFEKSSGRITWLPKEFSYIPKKVAGKKVKILGKWCCSGNEKMTKVTVPSTVKKIEKGAFYGCKKLKKIVLPKNVKMGDIEDNMIFWESNKLTTVVNNPDKKWKQRIQTFQDALDYLKTKKPKYYTEHVREFKNQWVPDEEGTGRHDYTDEEWAVVKNKAKELVKGCKSDMEKAKKISKWIVGHLHYNTSWMEQFQEWRKTHDEENEVFPIKKYTDAYHLITWKASGHDGETATTTCGGYGNLTQALFCAAGIPCIHCHRVQKERESIDHVFNAAYIGGKWIWLDNTYSDKTLNYFDCGIPGLAASDHRVDRINLEYLEELLKEES